MASEFVFLVSAAAGGDGTCLAAARSGEQPELLRIREGLYAMEL